MSAFDWLGIALMALMGGWMAFDGARALLTGSYVTPRTGPHAGQLGPWARVVRVAGADPASTLMKVVFVVFGSGWLTLALLGIFEPDWYWAAVGAGAIATLWYLPFGTTIAAGLVVLSSAHLLG